MHIHSIIERKVETQGMLVDERGNVVGGAGRERGVAGERELRGEEQFPAQLPGISAGRVSQTQGGERERAEV